MSDIRKYKNKISSQSTANSSTVIDLLLLFKLFENIVFLFSLILHLIMAFFNLLKNFNLFKIKYNNKTEHID